MSKKLGIAKIKNDNGKKIFSKIDYDMSIIITEYTENIIEEFISKNSFYEKFRNEYEKIYYETIKYNKLKKLNSKLSKVKLSIFEKYKNVKALEDKDKLFLELKNITSLESMIINYFLMQNKNNKTKINNSHKKGAEGEGIMLTIIGLIQKHTGGKVEGKRTTTTLEHDGGIDGIIEYDPNFDILKYIKKLLK